MRRRTAAIALSALGIAAVVTVSTHARPTGSDHLSAHPLTSVVTSAGKSAAAVASAPSTAAPTSPVVASQPAAAAAAFAKAALARVDVQSTKPTIPGVDPKLLLPSSATKMVAVNVAGASEADERRAVAAAGGQVRAGADGVVSATVPVGSLAALAKAAGVHAVTKPVGVITEAVSQGVVESDASVWQANGSTGAGVTVAVVDAGFSGLATQVAAGNLPAGTQVDGNFCGSDVNDTDHGTSVAEIVHQMAPGATLKLYCVTDTISLASAEAQIEAAGIKIVNASIAFPGDDRGDGTGGGATSAASTVMRASNAGILWVASAGNSGVDHWSADFSYDAATMLPNGTALTRLNAATDLDYVTIAQGQTAQFYLQWDDWPDSSLNISLAVAPSSGGLPTGAFQTVSQTAGSTPTLSQCFAPGGAGGCIDTDAFPSAGQAYVVGVLVPQGVPAIQFDLDYEGDVGPNALSCTATDLNTGLCTTNSPTPGSIAEPASSPYAFAVGAVDGSGSAKCGAGVAGTGTYPLENYSSQGPTIDGRTKPDLAAFDGVTNNANAGDPFCGTSASAPHVAGAAALVAQAHPDLSASGLETFLSQRANNGSPNSPATDAEGAGVLALGTPTSGTYQPITPTRLLDTRTGTATPMQPGATLALKVEGAGAIPASGVTAVVLNTTVTQPTATGYLTVWPGGTTMPGASNLNFLAGQSVPNLVVVQVGPNGYVDFYNGSAGTVHLIVDVSGYYVVSSPSPGALVSVAPSRVLDTRAGNGGTILSPGGTVRLQVAGRGGIPLTGAGTVVLNVTVTQPTASGYITVWGDGTTMPGVSNLNFLANQTIPNLVVAQVGSDGEVDLYNGSAGTVQLIADVNGYFVSGATHGTGTARPCRPPALLDTRSAGSTAVAPMGTRSTARRR